MFVVISGVGCTWCIHLLKPVFCWRTWTSESFILSHWSIVSIVSKDATAETSMILHGLCGPCFGNSNYLEHCCFSAWLVRSALDCLELTEHANAATMKSLSGVTACLNSFDQQISCFRKSIDIACFSPQGYYGFHVHCLHSHMVLNMKEVCSAVDLCTAYCRLLDTLRYALQEVQYYIIHKYTSRINLAYLRGPAHCHAAIESAFRSLLSLLDF